MWHSKRNIYLMCVHIYELSFSMKNVGCVSKSDKPHEWECCWVSNGAKVWFVYAPFGRTIYAAQQIIFYTFTFVFLSIFWVFIKIIVQAIYITFGLDGLRLFMVKWDLVPLPWISQELIENGIVSWTGELHLCGWRVGRGTWPLV